TRRAGTSGMAADLEEDWRRGIRSRTIGRQTRTARRACSHDRSHRWPAFSPFMPEVPHGPRGHAHSRPPCYSVGYHMRWIGRVLFELLQESLEYLPLYLASPLRPAVLYI